MTWVREVSGKRDTGNNGSGIESSMPPISATIVACNEAGRIVRALRSLASADEIVLVDSGSTDETATIAAGLGARVIKEPWHGYAAQKNFATDQARYDWILSLDADEELNPLGQAEIGAWKRLQPTADAYRFARRARYLGRWILHGGWYPDYKVRLFDRRKAQWEGKYVHESVKVNGRIATLPGEILHYTCDTREEHLQRIELYTDLAAQEMRERGQRVNFLRRSLDPPWVFFHTYFLRLGVLDGHQGFLIAAMAARYVRRKYQKLGGRG
jgi:glycosyltransferase involved in cell wall biosynthesis